MTHMTRTGGLIVATLGLALGPFCPVFAQDFVTELEPNDPCTRAQDIGAFVLPLVLDGSLNTPPDIPDVDFYRFSATPGTPLVAALEGQDTGKGTLPDPYLGLFNSNCELLEINDDFNSLNSRLAFNVPADGIFVLAASSCCDWEFIGVGNSNGTYQLTISEPPPSIGSITGRVVDAFSGDPLPGDVPPFAFVDLYRCEDGFCNYLYGQNTDSDGRFLFDRDYSGQLLPVGTYRVRAFANEYQDYETELFEVGANEDSDVGEIPLIPPLISFSDIQPCNELLPQGGICKYSVRINNNTSEPLRGLAWSLVDAYGIGSSLGFTNFEASASRSRTGTYVRRHRVSLDASSSDVVEFRFDVPSFVQDGATFCTRLLFGLEPYPLFNTNREGFLFCVYKGISGFEVMGKSESQELLRSVSGKNNLMMGTWTPAR